MEFVLKTRTYSIKKARERLGFVPWHNQNWISQEEAVKGSVRLYLDETNGGRLLTSKASDWPEYPFKLISDTGAKLIPNIPLNHFCLTNAKLMALTHNTIFRALNAIYSQALQINAGSQDAAHILSYSTVIYDFIHRHHVLEETMYFPEIDKAAGIPGFMDSNLEEHRKLNEGLEKFRMYAETTRKDQYSGEKLQAILENFAADFENHMHAEIKTIVNLHDKIDSKSLESICTAMFDASEHQSDIFK